MILDPFLLLSEAEQDAIINSWSRDQHPRLQEHTELAIVEAVHRRRRGLLSLQDGERVPGCSCPDCSGIPADHPARGRRADQRRGRGRSRPPLALEEAKRTPILDVAARLGLGEPERHGREFVVRCPLHEDARPSLRMNPRKGLWHCFPCAEGGDSIRLVMRITGCSFPDAVRFITGQARAA